MTPEIHDSTKLTPKHIRNLAKSLRADPTLAEKILWEALRGRRLNGLKFRRQHPVNHFIVDFYCPAVQLVIEIDGPIHAEPRQAEHDLNRDELLRAGNYRVVRFSSDSVMTNLNGVLDHIARLCL